MNVLSEIMLLLEPLNIPLETGYYSGKGPEEFIVLTPLADALELYADNIPQAEVQEVRISLFSKKNFIRTKKLITKLLLDAGFTISDRRYIGFEDDTKFHHYAIDVSKEYEMEDQ